MRCLSAIRSLTAAGGPGYKRAIPPKEREVWLCVSTGPKNSRRGAIYPIMRPKKVILCVDDNEQDLSVLKFMLVTNGYRVLSAITGQEAIGIFADNLIDLVLADFSMPGMNGDQLVGRLKQIGAHVPMVLLGDLQKMNGQTYGADAVLAKKTCSAQELLERVKVMSARKRGPRKAVHAPLDAELAVAS